MNVNPKATFGVHLQLKCCNNTQELNSKKVIFRDNIAATTKIIQACEVNMHFNDAVTLVC